MTSSWSFILQLLSVLFSYIFIIIDLWIKYQNCCKSFAYNAKIMQSVFFFNSWCYAVKLQKKREREREREKKLFQTMFLLHYIENNKSTMQTSVQGTDFPCFTCCQPRCTVWLWVNLMILHSSWRGTRWRSWLRHCSSSRKVADLIPDCVIGNFHWHNPSGRTMALGLSQPLTEMSTRNISWGVKAFSA